MDKNHQLFDCKKFRYASISDRRKMLTNYISGLSNEDLDEFLQSKDLANTSNLMVENAIGTFPIPIGIAPGFTINGHEFLIPMATEEPSIIAAASHGAKLASYAGGFKARMADTIMTAQLYLENVSFDGAVAIESHLDAIKNRVNQLIPKMKKRGGGFRALEWKRLSKSDIFRIHIHIDVCDAMGANVLNTVSEGITPYIENLCGGNRIMGILSNFLRHRLATAECKISIDRLENFGNSSMSGKEVSRRMVIASQIAEDDPYRAVTHNKGILNGIASLALATGNDTRAVSAAIHAHASRDGQYQGLSKYWISKNELHCKLSVPIALGTVGGAISMYPPCHTSLKILKNPCAKQLAKIAVSVGLSQNITALLALVTNGIQRGHMNLHANRIAFLAGASSTEEISFVVAKLQKENNWSVDRAREILDQISDKDNSTCPQ